MLTAFALWVLIFQIDSESFHVFDPCGDTAAASAWTVPLSSHPLTTDQITTEGGTNPTAAGSFSTRRGGFTCVLVELIPFKCLLVKYCKHKCFYNTIILFQPFTLTCVPFLVPLLQFRCFLFFSPLHSILFLSVTPPFLQAFAFSQGPPLSLRSYFLLLPNFFSTPPTSTCPVCLLCFVLPPCAL